MKKPLLYWTDTSIGDVDDPAGSRAACRVIFHGDVTEAEVAALLALLPAGAFKDVTDEYSCIQLVLESLRKVVPLDSGLPPLRFRELQRRAQAGSRTAMALGRLAVIRDMGL